MLFSVFYFATQSTSEVYTLSLHDALPISTSWEVGPAGLSTTSRPSIDRPLDLGDEEFLQRVDGARHRAPGGILVSAATEFPRHRSEEHTSELQSPYDLVCRLLLEKKKKHK